MDRIRDWFGRFSSGSKSSNTSRPRGSGSDSRQNRADHVTELHENVSRIQQEILALSNAAEGQTDGGTRGGNQARMADLERELDEAQKELAKYQGRI
jgi:peptidoglycan hydrolase CwlO-like protein